MTDLAIHVTQHAVERGGQRLKLKAQETINRAKNKVATYLQNNPQINSELFTTNFGVPDGLMEWIVMRNYSNDYTVLTIRPNRVMSKGSLRKNNRKKR